MLRSPLAILLPFLPYLAFAQYTIYHEAAAYIQYQGNITGVWTRPSNASNCSSSSSLGPEIQTSLFVGANQPWDPNPFFFEFYRSVYVLCGDNADPPCHLRREPDRLHPNESYTEVRNNSYLGGTEDSIYALDFVTASRVCMNDGELCETLQRDPYFVTAQVLDLANAEVERVDDVDGEQGYRVMVDEKAWVDNGTIKQGVSLWHDVEPGEPSTCGLDDRFVWCVRVSPTFVGEAFLSGPQANSFLPHMRKAAKKSR